VRDGQTLYRRAVGMADLEMGVPIAPEMVFPIASLTKPFTAQAVLMLAMEGRLALEDSLEKYFPDIPQFSAVTIHHLLSHTSGLQNYTDLPEWWASHRQDISVPDLIALFQNRPAVSQPGAKWAYNNSGYVLLGAIIESLTGTAYGDWIQQRICAPMGLAHTGYDDAFRVVPGRVHGYQSTGKDFAHPDSISITQIYAAGGLLSCADDMAQWAMGSFTGKILPEDWMREAFTPYALADGTLTRYGLGWFVGEWNGAALVEHLGSLPGFAHYLIGAPEQRLMALVLSNRAMQQQVPDALARSIIKLALE
jgi:D-alanyl-D-alanine carboxypeptidase